MQKIKTVIISLVIIFLTSIMMPFYVSADSTYKITSYQTLTIGNRDYYGYSLDLGIPRFYLYSTSSFSGKEDVRYTYGLSSGNNLFVYLVSLSAFNPNSLNVSFDTGSSSGGSSTGSTTYSLNGVTYYIMMTTAPYGVNYTPMFDDVLSNTTSSNSNLEKAVYYTYGAGAVDPSPSINYGDLQNVGFYTKFTNSQQSNISQMALNKDVITWDNYQDTNGNDLNDVNLRVDIQAASVDYEANSKSDLLNQTINDMLTGNWSDLITISPNVGEYSFTWETVARALFGSNYTANWWNNLFNVFDSAQGIFYKKGWIYRIRLRTADNSYVSDWQIIYNITSAPPSDSEKVYNNYYVYNYTIPDEETYRVINNINTINNTTNNWYQNDVPFNPDSGSNWWEKLLEFISEILQTILDFFSNIFDGLVDLILGLFDNINPAESFFNWFSDLFNGIHDIDLTLPQFNLPNEDLSIFQQIVQATLDIFNLNNLGFVIFIPLLLLIIRAVL